MAIGGMKKVGRTRFPTIRRSTDILQPEMGEADFSETMKTYDEEQSRSISETETVEQKLVRENEEREQQKKKKQQQQQLDEEAEAEVDEEGILRIDIRV